MIFVYILLGIIVLGVVIFKMGGKELDRRLAAVGGIRKMYAPLIDEMLSKPHTVLLKNTLSRLVIAGQCGADSYLWQISTPDGKRLTIRITVKENNLVTERKDFDFPIAVQWQSEDILSTLRKQIKHNNIL